MVKKGYAQSGRQRWVCQSCSRSTTFPERTQIDPGLKEYATERQARIIDAVNESGGFRAASRHMGVNNGYLTRTIRSLKARAAKQGYAPDHDLEQPVPEGFKLKGTSTLYDEAGNKRLQWYKTTEDRERFMQLVQESAQAMGESIPPADPVPAPAGSDDDLLSVYVVTDYHLGMLAWEEETGDDWDTDIAEDLLYKWFARAAQLAPASGRAVLAQLGDFLHYDSLEAVTPTNGNVLDADTRYPRLVRAAVRALRRVIALLLSKHKEVHLLMAEGNHDLASSVWLRETLAILYENEPRVTVDQTAHPYYCVEHGTVMVAFHHGHQRKPGELAEVFAAQYRETFGRTTKAYGHCGHRHHRQVIETPLMPVEQHPTLAARDSHAARGGYMAERTASVITYDRNDGEVQRTTVPASKVRPG